MQTAVEPGGRVREPLRRRAVVASVSGTLLLAGAIAVVRHDGFPARRFIAAHARRWLVHEPTGNLALADEVSGRVVARVASDRPNHLLDTAQGSVGAFLLDRSTSQAMRIDERGLRLEQPRSLPGLSADQPLSAVSVTPDGLVAVSGGPGTLSILPLNGVARSQPVVAASHPALITPAGRVWQLDSTDGHARLVDPSGTLVVLDDSSGDADFTSVGNDVVVIERRTGEVDWFPGRQVAGLAGLVDTSDAVLQEPGPAAPCAWIGSGDELICVRADRVAQRLRLGDELPFQFHRGDRLAISAAVGVILESSGTVFSVDLASGVMRRVAFSWSSTDHRQLTSTDDGIWIDDPLGAGAALVTSGGVTTFDKLDSRAPLFGQDGLPLEVGGRTNRPDTVEADPAPDVPAPTDLIARAPDNDGIAEAPVANPDIVSGLADDAVLIAVTANDYDPDGDPIAVTKVTASSHGSLTIASPGQIEYRPNPGYSGPDSFTYTVADPTGNESRAAVSIEVLAPNSPDTAPIAAADFRQTAGIRPLMIDALANDVDADRDLLRLTNLGALPPTMGTVKLVVRSDGREVVVFTPGPDAAGRTVSFTYQAIDTHGRVSAPARMTIEVAAVGAPNRPPLAQPDAVQARAGRSVLIPVLTNDVDPDNDALSITSASVDDPASGTVVVDGSQLRFTSAPTASGDVIVRYAISDGNPGESSAAVLVRVIDLAAPDVAPIARPDLRVTPGDAIIFDPTTNDIDPDGDPLLISKFDQPIAGGTVTRVGPSTLQVTPAGGFAGTLSFPYVVTDGKGRSTTGVIVIDVNRSGALAPPEAFDDSASTVVDRPVDVDVLANDRDPSRGIPTLIGVVSFLGGRCSVNATGNRVHFEPPAGRDGVFTCIYEVSNATGQTASAIATITVNPLPPSAPPTSTTSTPSTGAPTATQPATDDLPVARDDIADAVAGVALNIDVFANDTVGSGHGRRVINIGKPSPNVGTVTSLGTSLQYTAPASFTGVVQFEYQARDVEGHSTRATVTVTVRSAQTPNQAPKAINETRVVAVGSGPVLVNVLDNDIDPDGRTADLRLVSASSVGPPATIERNGPSLIVTPSDRQLGDIVVTYTVADLGGLTDTGTLTITVVATQNRPPAAAPDVVSTAYGQPVFVAVLANDTDPDGDQLVARLESTPPAASGTVALTADGQRLSFSPAAGFEGAVTFTYTAIDPSGLASAPTLVTVNVASCSASPALAPDRRNEFTPFGTPLTLTLLDPSQLSYRLTVGSVAGGTVTVGTSGQVLFTPASGNNGVGTFGYTVTNPCGNARSGSVVIDVNRAPAARNISRTVVSGDTLTVAVDEQASDTEPLVFAAASVDVGTVKSSQDGGSIRFVAPPGFVGSAHVQTTVRDPGGLTASATITIDVTPPANQTPVAASDDFTSLPGVAAAFDVLGNDYDPDGDQGSLRIEIVDNDLHIGPQPVKARLSPDGRTVLFDFGPDAHGRDFFRYRAIDALGGVSNIVKAFVTVNRPPNFDNASISFPRGGSDILHPLRWKVMDDDGDPVHVISVGSVSAGLTAVLDADDTITVQAAADSPDTGQFTFTVADSYGATRTSTIDVTITG